MFRQLKRAAPEAQEEVDKLLDEHSELIAMGRAFLRLVRAVEEEAVVTRAELSAIGRSYLDKLTEHMNKEEAGLFRLAADRLGPSDWEAIGGRVEAMEDPLFGPAVAADYRRLWQRITAHPPGR
jgi:hemerythrin-like domain-containing protein